MLAPGSGLRYAAGLAGLDWARAAAAADRLREADVLVAGRALAFAHPIVREAVLSETPPSRLAGLHAEAARLLAADGEAPDHVAAHLLSAEPYGQEWVVDALRHAATRALAQGAPEAAVAYLRRARAEPPAPGIRLQVLVELGRAETRLPSAPEFGALEEALALATDPTERAELANELALALFGVIRSEEGMQVLERALEDRDALAPELVERLEGSQISGGAPSLPAMEYVIPRMGPLLARARRDETRDPEVLSALAMTGAVTGLTAAEAGDLARRSLADGVLLGERLDTGYVSAAVALAWCGYLEDAAAALDEGIAAAQRQGWAAMFMQLATFRCETALRAGDLYVAEDYGRRAYELALDLGAEQFVVMALSAVLLERGDTVEALELIGSVLPDGRVVDSWPTMVLLAQRGRVRIEHNDLARGVADILEADRQASAAACDLTVLVDWMPSATLGLVRLGRREQARAVANREVAAANAFGAPRRRGLAMLARGLVDDGDGGLASLRHAVEMLGQSGAELEHARALVALGAGLRERGQGKLARGPLAEGQDLAWRLGAETVAAWARTELLATGARPRRKLLSGIDALTPAELRTARIAADGLSNREIAQVLFVSTKTVEAQLSQVYTKLGIHGRGHLAAALGAR